MKEPAIHRAVAKLPNGSGIAVRQNALRPKLSCNRLQPSRDLIERLVPRDPLKRLSFTALLKRAFRNALAAPHRIEQPIGRVDAIEILRDFAAQKATCHRV